MRISAIRAGAPAAVVVSALVLAALPQTALPQSFPNKQVTVVSAYTAGSASDAIIRQINERLNKKWGQPVLMEYRPGAALIPAVQTVLRAPADGHTAFVMDTSYVIGQ